MPAKKNIVLLHCDLLKIFCIYSNVTLIYLICLNCFCYLICLNCFCRFKRLPVAYSQLNYALWGVYLSTHTLCSLW